jgi:hypothetical protein
MMPPTSTPQIARALGDYLEANPPTASVGRDERAFQKWVYDQTTLWLKERGLSHLTVKGEASGGGVSPIRSFGAGSWPDVTVVSGDPSGSETQTIAIEVKCLKQRGLPNRIAQALGQAFVYRENYERCLVVLILLEKPRLVFPQTLLTRLSDNDIDIALVPAFQPAGARTSGG